MNAENKRAAFYILGIFKLRLLSGCLIMSFITR
jgi:hypothetical protein